MLVCVVSADTDPAAVFDIATITDQLRAARADCGWLLLVDGQQKLCDRDFAKAAELLRSGS